MKLLFLILSSLFLLTNSIGQENFVIEGEDVLDETQVLTYTFNFGSHWRGPSGSTVCMKFEFNRTEVERFGERAETFHFIPPGETETIDIVFALGFQKFENGEFTFGLAEGSDARICPNLTKIIPTNIICISEGDPTCNGIYRYMLTVGDRVDYANSEIEFFGGQAPRLTVLDQVNSIDANTYQGLLGTTFQSTVDRSKTIRIQATDFQGEPRGNIVWTFRGEGSSSEIALPGSLADVAITEGAAGESTLEISGVSQVHLGEYIATATNEHGSDRASAFVTRGTGPFIAQGSGQSSVASFRVGADRAVTLGETVSIRAEDGQSDPSSTITWWYSRSQSGSFSAISAGGPYSISSASGAGNVGTDSTLSISNVGPAQYGYYSAVATNEFGTHSSQTSLVGRSPQLTRGSGIATSGADNIGAQFDGIEGSTVIIRAFDEAGFPDSSYRWQRVLSNGALQDVSTGGRYQIISSTSGGRPVSTLVITGVTQSELGTYRATASNGLTPADIAESLVGRGSSCDTSSSVTRVSNGQQVESAGRFDTTNANTFSIIARDSSGVPHGTVSWLYSRTPTGSRSSPSSAFTSTNTPSNSPGTISFNNLQDAAYGYYFARLTNQFGSSECENLVGRQLAFQTGAGQIGEDSTIQVGNSLTITAQFSDGFPIGEITWRGPNGPITPGTAGYTIVSSPGISSLTINSARDGLDFGDYTASASNEFGTVTSTSTVSESTVVVAPTIDEERSDTINTGNTGKIGGSFQAPTGQVISIRANDLTGVEASTVQWTRIPPGGDTFVPVTNSAPFAISSQPGADGKTESVLTFTVGPDTYGTYRAQASNSAGSDSAISVVGQPPQLDSRFTARRVTSGQSSTIAVGGQVNIDEGGTLSLTATDLEGQPGRNFEWTYRNDPSGPFVPLPASSKISEFANENVGTLQISNIDRTMYGEYRVRATNEFGESNEVTTIVGAAPIIRFSTGTETDGMGEIGQNFVIPIDRRLRITACVIGGYPPAPASNFQFLEQNVELGFVQQLPPNDNCFIYEEGEFEITCGTTITARTENIFGISNEPSSSIIFPPPAIMEGSSTCNQGSTANSAQIGSQLCLYGRTSFDITCSVERTNIPNFSFEWQLNGSPILPNGRHRINNQITGSSILSVSGISVDDTGRYTCSVRSVCGDTDAASTDVNRFEYEYVCNEDVGRVICLESANNAPQTTVSNAVCDGLGIARPECDICDWVMTQWSSCSDTTCHRGRRTREVNCECNGITQEDDQCDSRRKPEGMDRCGPLGIRCNRPFEWKVYSLTPCSAPCGNSIRSRRVECVSSITDNRVSDEECNELFKPKQNVECNVPSCSQCVDLMAADSCEVFIGIVGDCNQHPFYVRSQCCSTCARLGL